MPNEIKEPVQTTQLPHIEIVEPKEAVVRAYANISHLSWSGSDLTVQLYQLEQPNRDVPSQQHAANRLIHTASVTLTWASAKSFYQNLGSVLERYEKAYGPISTDFKQI